MVNDFFAYLLMSYRNSIGDISTPDYTSWIKTDTEKVTETTGEHLE